MITVTTTGRIFEKPNLLLANVRAGEAAEAVLGPALRAAFSGGIVRRGPGGRYGHLSDAWHSNTTTDGSKVTTRVFPKGPAAFKAVFLEKGTRAPHKGGRVRGMIFPRDRRERAAKRTGHAAALRLPGGIFRRNVFTSGMRAFRPVGRTLETKWPTVKALYDREIARELGAM